MNKGMKYYSVFIFIIVFLCVKTESVFAQDFHFSQMKFTPLNVNPSLAGLNGKYNAAINYRSQWNSVAAPYTTLGGSFDVHLDSPSNRTGFLAGGVNFYHDIAGDLKLNTSNVSFTGAYHLKVDRESTLGLGLQVGYAQRSLGESNGVFASQYDGEDFDPSIASGESFGSRSHGYMDVGAGMVYKHNSLTESNFGARGFIFTTGVAAYHLRRPAYSFLQSGKDALSIRYSGFVDAEFKLNDARYSLMPAIYYQRQGSHQEILFGSYIKYKVIQATTSTSMRNDFVIAYGAFYRFGDAFVNKLLLDLSGYALGVSYDLNVSTLTQASRGRGGIEFMFRYHLKERNQRGARIR